MTSAAALRLIWLGLAWFLGLAAAMDGRRFPPTIGRVPMTHCQSQPACQLTTTLPSSTSRIESLGV
jgi:hypothetical protein